MKTEIARAAAPGDKVGRSPWTAAGAIGAAVALGSYDLAVLLALVNFITLRYLAPLRRPLHGDEDEK